MIVNCVFHLIHMHYNTFAFSPMGMNALCIKFNKKLRYHKYIHIHNMYFPSYSYKQNVQQIIQNYTEAIFIAIRRE
jgi:hypothetical protein